MRICPSFIKPGISQSNLLVSQLMVTAGIMLVLLLGNPEIDKKEQ
jgi:hypothetical protein